MEWTNDFGSSVWSTLHCDEGEGGGGWRLLLTPSGAYSLVLSTWSSGEGPPKRVFGGGIRDRNRGIRESGTGSLAADPEIQVAIRSLRLRFTEISRATETGLGLGLGIWYWYWVLDTGYSALVTGHTWPADLICALSPASRLQVATRSSQLATSKFQLKTWPIHMAMAHWTGASSSGKAGMESSASRLMNNAFAQGAEESGRRIELPIWCRLSDQLS